MTWSSWRSAWSSGSEMTAKSRGTAEALEGKAAIQREAERLEEWADRSLTKFNEDKSQVVHVGRKSPWRWCRWEPARPGAALKRPRGSWWAVTWAWAKGESWQLRSQKSLGLCQQDHSREIRSKRLSPSAQHFLNHVCKATSNFELPIQENPW